jgi:hypothetical protein
MTATYTSSPHGSIIFEDVHRLKGRVDGMALVAGRRSPHATCMGIKADDIYHLRR